MYGFVQHKGSKSFYFTLRRLITLDRKGVIQVSKIKLYHGFLAERLIYAFNFDCGRQKMQCGGLGLNNAYLQTTQTQFKSLQLVS